MLRVVLEFLALMLAPAVLYVGYAVFVRRSHSSVWDAFKSGPLVLLFFIGLALVFLSMIVWRSREEASAGKAYFPPVYKDGKIIPGQIK